MECDSCTKQFCAKRLKIPTAAYDYMSKTKGIWCCDECTENFFDKNKFQKFL